MDGTGSGKTVLFKLLLMQCIKKGALVYLADFKGAVDYKTIWHEKCKIVVEEQDLIDILEDVENIINQRKVMFKKAGCQNIIEYNKNNETKLQRIILAFDEVAEVLDKTGLTKEQKEKKDFIISKMSTIARQGRSYGVNLFLCTQRPSADIIPGQINNNIQYRLSGRATKILADIILDNPNAANRIPNDGEGVFITYDEQVFKSYYINDTKVFANDSNKEVANNEYTSNS